jgi:lysophospholipase L1-like esterase
MNALAMLLATCVCALLLSCAAQAEQALEWHDAATLTIEGKAWPDTQSPFDRLPARALDKVTDSVKGLSKQSAGMAIRFRTDSGTLRVRWSLGDGNYTMTHMAATGTSGLDLYLKLPDGHWTFAGVGRPEEKQDNEALFFSGAAKQARTYLLYLPLFNRVTSLSIGVDAGSSFEIVPNAAGKRVVFYGTSIVHGGCASRPGMAYPAIIGRAQDCETINLGFSGAGRTEPEICDLLAELDADAFVIDALPNMGDDPVTERMLYLVRTIRKQQPLAPITLVESITYQRGRAFGSEGRDEREHNAKLRAAYDLLVAEGVTRLHYLPGADLLGNDCEGTVDGAHPTDLGFARMAHAIGAVVAQVLAQEPVPHAKL